MRLPALCTLALLLGTSSTAHAKGPRWRMFNSNDAEDVVVMPGNLTVGWGASLDARNAYWGAPPPAWRSSPGLGGA